MGLLDDIFGKTTKTDKSKWEGPFHGTINDREVTVVTGKEGTSREGHTLIKDGLVDANSDAFKDAHDHFSRNSEPGDAGDKGHSNVPNT